MLKIIKGKLKMKLNKIIPIIFLLALILLITLGSVNAFTVNFEEPTPSDGITGSSISINVSTDALGDTYTFVDWNSSLVAWWNMGNVSGTTVYDDSTYSNHLTMTTGATHTNNGYWGKGMWFNISESATARLNAISYGSELEFGENPTFTISGWINPDTMQSLSAFVGKRNLGGGFTFYFTDTGKLRGYIVGSEGNTGIFEGTTTIEENKWSHILIVSTGTHVNFYINGIVDPHNKQKIAILDGIGSINDSSSQLRIGYYNAAFNGAMDDIMIFNKALSYSEIKSLYNSSANKYYANYSSEIRNGLNFSYTAYVVNKTGTVNSSTRTFNFLKSVIVDSPKYNDRYYTSPIDLKVTSNFEATCFWSNDSGNTNYTMDSFNSLDHNYTAFFPETNIYLDFWCNDSEDSIYTQRNFEIVENIIYYVDAANENCSDTYSKNYASNVHTPLCSIYQAEILAEAGDEIIVKYGHNYCEGFSATNSGTIDNPILIRGESNTQRTFLNGSCASEINAFTFTGQDNWIIRYFEAFNFSNDGGNVHAKGSDNSLNIFFENLTINNMGWIKDGAAGDGLSFHENCTGHGKWLNMTNGLKGGIDDIAGANTNYSNIFINSFDVYGIGFLNENLNGEIHYIDTATIRNSANCLFTYDDTVINDLTCINNTGSSSGQIYILGGTSNITRFTTVESGVRSSIRVLSADANFIDGLIDSDVILTSNSSVTLTNVTYGVDTNETIQNGSSLTKNWYLDVSTNKPDTKITILDSTGDIIYSNFTSSSIQQTLTSYVNNGGTITNQHNYTVIASGDDYVTQMESINLTSNTQISFSLNIDISKKANDTNNIVFVAFSIIALFAIVGSIAVIISFMQGNINPALILTLTLSAIIVAIILLAGFYILGTLASVI